MYHLKQDFLRIGSENLYSILVEKLRELESIDSITKNAKYRIINITDRRIRFERINTTQEWEISKDELLSVLNYIKNNEFNTSTLHTLKLVPRKQSPTIAFLLATHLIEKQVHAYNGKGNL